MALTRASALAGPRLPRRRSVLARREALYGYLFLLPWIVGFLWFTAGPVLASLGLSVTDFSAGTGPVHFVGLSNYLTMLTNDHLFWQSLRVTALYSVLAVPLGLVFSLGVALLLNQRVRLLPVWRTLFYLPSLITGVAQGLLWQFMFNEQFGFINEILNSFNLASIPWLSSESWIVPSLVLATLWGSTSGMLIFLGGLQGIPTELYEASAIDGAGLWRKFWNVTVPMLTPTIFYNLIFGIINSFQVFTLIYVVTSNGGSVGGPNYASYAWSVYIYQSAFQFGRIGYAAGLGWVLFALILLLTLGVFRSARRWVFYAGE